jgi:hypothetical protein
MAWVLAVMGAVAVGVVMWVVHHVRRDPTLAGAAGDPDPVAPVGSTTGRAA